MKPLLSLFFGMMLLHGFGQFASFPVTLSIPYDQDTVETTTPTFVWQCNLSGIQSDPRLSLQFALVELGSEQTASEAIVSNEAICTVNGLLSSSYSYPSTLEELEKGKTYVWQVQVLFNDQIVQESEPWKFTIADPRPPINQYITLNQYRDGGFHVFTNRDAWLILKEEFDFETQLALVRTPNNEKIAVTLEKVIAGNQQGEGGAFNESAFNYLYCQLEDIPECNGIYSLEVISKSGLTYTLNFTLE